MSVALGRVEKQIADSRTRDVLVLWCHVRKDDPGRDFGARPADCRLSEVAFTKLWEAQKPEHCVRQSGQYSEPAPEGGRIDL